MKTEAVVQAFLALLQAQQFDDMPKFVVATSSTDRLDVLSVYSDGETIFIDVEAPEVGAPTVSTLLLTYDAVKAVSYKDILRV